MTLFSRSPDFKKIKRERSTGRYDSSPWPLRKGLELTQSGLLGNAAFEIVGLDNLLNAVENSDENNAESSEYHLSQQEGKNVIFGTSHLTDIDVSVAAAIASQVSDIKVPVASTNFTDPRQEIPYRMAGLDTVYKVPYSFADGGKDQAGYDKVAGHFDSSDYEELVKKMKEQGFSVVAAAHNPMTMHGFNNDGKLPEKPGKLVPHLALATGRPILPVLMQVEGQQNNPTQLNDNAIHPSWTFRKKDVRMTFGESMTPTNDEIGNYNEILQDLRSDNSEAAQRKQREVLKQLGGVVLGWMQDNYDEKLAKAKHVV